MKLEIDIPDEWLERFKAVKIPAELCGSSIEERITYMIGTQLDGFESVEQHRQSVALHEKFGVRHPSQDDDISF
jgi:hypothetical protein